jgi:molecular chaperone DnaK (HSP70)
MKKIRAGGNAVYGIGIGLGATHISAASLAEGLFSSPHLDGPTAVVPTTVYVEPDGRVLCGSAAHTRGLQDPDGLVRHVVARIGTGQTLIVGAGTEARSYRPEDIAAATIAWVVATVASTRDTAPSWVAVAHPVEWHGHQVEALRAALRPHDLPRVHLIGEHLAAGRVCSAFLHPVPGRPFAVLDVGATGVRAAVLRTDVDGNVWPLGRPHWSAGAGGDDHDDALLATLVRAIDPDGSADLQARMGRWDEARLLDGLRTGARRAKEHLSQSSRTDLVVELDGRRFDITITREALEAAIASSLARVVGTLQATVAAAGVSTADLAAVFLAGGGSQIPGLATQLTASLGSALLVAREADPSLTAAAGAILSVPGLAETLAAPATPAIAAPRTEPDAFAPMQPILPRAARRLEPVRPAVPPREPIVPAPTGRPVTSRRTRPTPRRVVPPRGHGTVGDLVE